MVREPKSFVYDSYKVLSITMKRITFDFNVSDRYCNGSINTQHAYDNNLIKDRGGWISTPYEARYK